MTVRESCTLCGGPRDYNMSQAEFDCHVAMERHQRALAEWDKRHPPQPTHHDGHVTLQIACRCTP